MKVWIDLANSPHVLVFKPVVEALEARGHEVVITLREFAQTVELAERLGLDGPVIGRHGGASLAGKVRTLSGRTRDLRRFARHHGVDVAVSLNSYAQTVAARSAGLHTVTLMDYEGQPANHVAFRAANVVVVPACFPQRDLRRFGARPSKVRYFPGFKEQLYLDGFQPIDVDEELERAAKGQLAPDWRDRPLVVLRPPATMALYHRFENELLTHILDWLNTQDVQVVALPRTPAQGAELLQRLHTVAVPEWAIDGPSLVGRADLVISAGGTMNREAAVLGTPAFTIFAGALPAVDHELIRLGRLRSIDDAGQLAGLAVGRKVQREQMPGGPILQTILDAIGA